MDSKLSIPLDMNSQNHEKIMKYIFLLEYLLNEGYLKKEVNESLGNLHKEEKYYVTIKAVLSSNSNKIFYARQFENKDSMNFYNKFKINLLNKYNWLELTMLEDKKAIGNVNNYIKSSIDNCSIFIADLSTNDKNYLNYNVMYEIGMAHALDKKTYY